MKLVMKTLWQLLMKGKKYWELKEKVNLIEEGKINKQTNKQTNKQEIGINEVIKCNKIINNSLKPQIQNLSV